MNAALPRWLRALPLAVLLCIAVTTAQSEPPQPPQPPHVAADALSDALTDATLYLEAGRLKEAVQALKAHTPRDETEDRQVSVLMGRIYLAIDRPDKALPLFEAAQTAAAPPSPLAFDAAMGIAQAQLKLGRFADARRSAQRARQLDAASPEPEWLLAMADQRAGASAEARTRMDKFVRQHATSEPHALVYARYLAAAGEPAAAIAHLKAFRTAHPPAAAATELLGDLEFGFGSKTAALDFKRAAAVAYASDGNEFRVRVIRAWVEERRAALAPQKSASPASPPPQMGQRVTPGESPAPPAKPSAKAAPTPVPAAPAPRASAFADRDVVVPVQRFPFPPDVTITGGSGFIIDGGKKIVTNKHVVEGGREFAIRTGLGEVIRAKLVFVSETDDLALLALDKPLPADRAVPNTAYAKPRVGRDVVVMGYPLWYILGEGSPSLTNGVVSKSTGMKDDLRTFQLTAKVNRGNSGGPVFDLNGNVVGITVGKLDGQKISQEQGFVPEDINFAIHVDRLPPMANIDLRGQGLSDKPVSPEVLYQQMLGRVVMVATYK